MLQWNFIPLLLICLLSHLKIFQTALLLFEGLLLGFMFWCMDREGEEEGGRQKTCSHSLLREQEGSAGAAHPGPAPAPPLAVPGAPPPRFTDLQNLGMWMAKIPWHKYMFADHISDHVLFIIMTCSETVCYSYVGLPWIFFPLLVHWKQHGGRGGGGEANERMFLCLYVTSNGYLKKLRKGIHNIPGVGSREERKWD